MGATKTRSCQFRRCGGHKTFTIEGDSGRKRPSRQLRDFSFWIEMLRLPAEIVPRLAAAQLLVERIAPGPVAELSRYRIRGDDLRFAMPGGRNPSRGNCIGDTQ
jgi:hypothetical protein